MVHGGAVPRPATQRVQAAKALFVARTIMRARQTRRAAMFERFRAMVQHQNGLLLAAVVAASSSSEERRTVNRALGKWRGSTLSGYLRDGDDQTYLENFRCTKARFEFIVHQLQDSPLDLAPPKVLTSDWRKVRRTQRAREVADPPSRRYKVACALYAMGQGGPIKVLADAASIGKSTLRKYLEQYADACTKRLKPIYMPGTPWSREERTAVQDKFASRRGFRPVSLACD